MKKKLLYHSFTSERVFPKNLIEKDRTIFEKEFQKKINPSYLFEFKNVAVTFDGVVINNLKTIPESLYDLGASDLFKWKYLLKTFITKRKIKLDKQKYILPYNSWGTGYCHWVPETLCRILSAKYLLPECILLLPDNIHPQIIKSLAPFKFKGIFYIPKNSYVITPDLIMPTLIGQTGNYNDKVIKNLRQLYLDFYEKKLNPHKQNIYVSREKADKRKIQNEKEIKPILSKYNFKIIYIEELDFEEQVSLFMNCNCVISIHGAALANILFMKNNAKVLEIRNSSDKTSLCYFSLASALDIDYYYFKGNSTDLKLNNNANLIIEPTSFEQTLIEMTR